MTYCTPPKAEGDVTDEQLSELADMVRETLASHRPGASYEVRDLREFLDLTDQIARSWGVEDYRERSAILDEAARLFVARATRERILRVVRSALELGDPTPTSRGAAFFTRFSRL